uniref:Uncharacterized protein n=1 Tax=Ciona savignyi TaxID=51511 RepID=H2YNX5_CIOSA
MPSTLPNIQNIDGSVVMRTGTPSGTILNFRDTEASLDVGIIKPNLKPVDGEDALAGGATAIPAEREMMTTAGGDLGSGGVPVEDDLAAAPAEVNPALDEAGSIGGAGGSNEEEAIDGGANPIDITETELADQPMIDTEEQARYALPPSDDEASDTTA